MWPAGLRPSARCAPAAEYRPPLAILGIIRFALWKPATKKVVGMSRLDDFDVVIRKNNGRIVAGIPQAGLYAVGDDIPAVLAALEEKKKAFVADLEEAGELGLLDVERRPAGAQRLASYPQAAIKPPSDIGRFILKTGIVVVAVIVIFVGSGLLIASQVDRTIANVKSIKIGGRQFWTRVENEIHKMASPSSDLPEDKKQKLLADIRAIAAKWRPFVTEIQAALAEPENSKKSAGAAAREPGK
jgi:hypothetical protein